jgi:membrane associated rhomboid family serine protease
MVGAGGAATAAGIPIGVGLSRRHHARMGPPGMNCAACKQRLQPLPNLQGTRAWKCGSCQAVAADLGSLRKAVPEARMAALQAALREGAPGNRGCPRCAQPMRRGRLLGGYGTIEIDACRPCLVAWFDPGELKSLRATLDQDDTPVLSALSPEERRAWRMGQLRRDAHDAEQDSNAAMLGMLLGVPMPEDLPGQKAIPYATWAIAGSVTAASVLAFGTGVHAAAERFGLVPADLDAGRASTLFTHFFVHADPYHLAGNLMFFVAFGPKVEALVGRVRFCALVLLATAAGGLAHAAAVPHSDIPLIGASGGISGVLTACVCLRPRSTVRMVWAHRVLRVPAAGFLALWFVLQLFGIAAQVTGVSAISALAHLGGAALGCLLGLVWRRRAQAVLVGA